jgi:predicted transposase YbfD/YdcC
MPRVTAAQAQMNAVEEEAIEFFENALSSLPDPRRTQGVRYPLRTVVVVALMAMVCGAEDAQGMELWGKANEEWLSSFLKAPHGMPTQDVFLSVFAALNPKIFGEVFQSWAQVLFLRLEGKERSERHIAVDGKTSRRSFDLANGKAPLHTVSAWSSDLGLVLGQVKTSEKSNEITAIPELLKLLDITQATITIDAMGCQREIAATIINEGGEYLLALKKNQSSLLHDVESAFTYADRESNPFDELAPPQIEVSQSVAKGHGRLEERKIELSRDLSWIESRDKWKNMNFYARVTRKRTNVRTGKISEEVSYYIGSHPTLAAKDIGHQIRRHWSIENELHWVLDMAFREDEARHRAKNTAQNMATLRHFALNIINLDKNRKLGVANSRKRAGWDRDYLINLLSNCGG